MLEKKIENTINGLKKLFHLYYEKTGKKYPLELKKVVEYDYINPKHYVGDDGRQTWERMVDKWGEEKTALWCEMTAFKYLDTRMGNKPNENKEREMKKVEWYQNKAKELYEIHEKKEKEKAERTNKNIHGRNKKGRWT